MTEKGLKEYKSLVRQSVRLQGKIDDEKAKDLTEVIGKVKGSSSRFPYIEQRYSVPMYAPDEYDSNIKRIRKLEAELAEKERKINVIEAFINSIEDEKIKEIFNYYFIDGMTQDIIADKVGYDRSVISRKISNYLKLAHKTHF